jgi:hypothetical protein
MTDERQLQQPLLVVAGIMTACKARCSDHLGFSVSFAYLAPGYCTGTIPDWAAWVDRASQNVLKPTLDNPRLSVTDLGCCEIGVSIIAWLNLPVLAPVSS